MPIAQSISFRPAEFGLDLREKPETRVAGRTAKPPPRGETAAGHQVASRTSGEILSL
jgi:hypothetical protein